VKKTLVCSFLGLLLGICFSAIMSGLLYAGDCIAREQISDYRSFLIPFGWTMPAFGFGCMVGGFVKGYLSQ